MMTHTQLNLDKSFDLLNTDLRPYKIAKPDFEIFGKALKEYLQKLPTLEHDQEKRTEQAFTHFLQMAFPDYQGDYVVASVEDIDLTINRKHEERPSVLIECKKPSETKDFPHNSHLNVKALHQLIYYYLKETIEYHNTGIKSLIITNGKELYIFDEAIFNRCFGEKYNKTLKQEYQNKLDGKRSTEEFYTVVRRYLEEHPETFEKLNTLHFSLEDLSQELKKPDLLKSRRLQKAYKALCKFSLLKEAPPNTGNTLNQAFYDELLHIIGLEEVKADGKKLIQRKQNTPESASLIESILSQNKERFAQHTTPQNKDDKVIELVITWVNRILFLKLLEAQLVRYHQGNQTFKFMSQKYLTDWDHVHQLFFDVLAIKEQERSHDARVQALHFVPYLNSSLFERSELEQELGTINNLTENELELHPRTVLKHHGKRRTGTMRNIDYLLSFLDAYDFGSDAQDDGVQHHDKTLINASVLGLVFEKINGYKEGSFYTPSVITMYMCKESLRLAVLQKLNEAFDWQHSEWQDLKMACMNLRPEEKIKASNVINQLKICDPAVGSGHFLVSALNQLLAIKADLELLVKDGRVYPLDIRIVNDELVIQDDYADGLFQYQVNLDGLTQKRSVAQRPQAIQELLFDEKRTLIEQCLFGVDINPNSVQICRLRLWIELLKNTYYKSETGYKELETLPNIDINIKCGNSLISRFGLNQKVDGRTTKGKAVQELQELTRQYYHVDRNVKKIIETRLNEIKSNLNGELLLATKTREDRFKQETLIRDLKIEVDNIELVFNNSDFMSFTKETKGEDYLNDLKGELVRKRLALSNAKVKLKQLDAQIEEEDKNPLFSHAFEWRFEFPDVLHPETGDFEGFDVVIGNPPYIFARESKNKGFTPELKKYFYDNFELAEYQLNLYPLFIEQATRLLKKEGIFSFITPNNWMTINTNSKLRKLIFKQSNVIIVNCLARVFESADVDTSIILFQKNGQGDVVSFFEYEQEFKFIAQRNREELEKTAGAIINIEAYKGGKTEGLLQNIENLSKPLNEFADVKAGLKAYETGKGKPICTAEMKASRVYHAQEKHTEKHLRYLQGKDVCRYHLAWSGEYLEYGENLAAPRTFNLFNTPRILVRQIPNKPPYCIHAVYTEETMLNDLNSMNIIEIKTNPSFILGVLNSRLTSYWFIHRFGKMQRGTFPQFKINELKEFPIPQATDAQQAPLVARVNEILALHQAPHPNPLPQGEGAGTATDEEGAGRESTPLEPSPLPATNLLEPSPFGRGQGEGSSKARIAELEAEIDVLVYQLYQLTYDDVLVIDPTFAMPRVAYESGLAPTGDLASVKVNATPLFNQTV